MDTELLKTFLEVSRTRHFGRAAEALYLTQSAVSFRIRQLENQLGVSLFTRHRNNIRLTSAGERLRPYAENLMNTWLEAKKEVSLTSRHSELSIGANASLWECILTPWLEQLYCDQSNKMQFEARIAQRQFLVKQLHERQLDLLITTEPPKMEELCSQLVGHFILGLYCAAPKRPKSALNYLRLEWGADFQQHEDDLVINDDIPQLVTSSAKITVKMLPLLNGCTWLPIEWARHKSELVPVIDSTTLSRPLYAVWLQTSDKQNLIRSIIKTQIIKE